MKLFAFFVVGSLLLPVARTVWVSFSPDSFLTPPESEWSLRWYREFSTSPRWQNGLFNSLRTAVASASLGVALGLPLSFAIHRRGGRWGRSISMLLFLPMVVPPVAFGMGLLALFASLGIAGSSLGLILAHAVVVLPVVCLLLLDHLAEIPCEFERAAAGLGASGVQIVRRVLLPILRPTILASFVAAAVISWNESLLAIFLTGPRSETLPAIVWPQLRFAASPLVAVASAASIALAVVGVLAVRQVDRYREVRRPETTTP